FATVISVRKVVKMQQETAMSTSSSHATPPIRIAMEVTAGLFPVCLVRFWTAPKVPCIAISLSKSSRRRPAHGCSGSSRRICCPARLHSLCFRCTPLFRQRCCSSFFTRARDHQLVTMQQQLPQVAHFTRWHPDPRKPPLDQQLQNMRRIALVRLLLPHVAGTNLRRIAHPQLVTQLAQQIHQPVTVAGGFHADQRL